MIFIDRNETFQDTVGNCNLTYMEFTWALFAWWNKRDEDSIGKKLDQALINAGFSQSSSRFKAGGISDHARCVGHLPGTLNETRKPFRFSTISPSMLIFCQWLKEYETQHMLYITLDQLWESSMPSWSYWNVTWEFSTKLTMGILPNKTKLAFEEICRCPNHVLLDPNSATFVVAAEASDRWYKLASIEEDLFRQKYCIRWLWAGDHNTFLFHRAMQTRSSRNTIKSLVSEDEAILTKLSDIKKKAVLHF